MLLQEDVSSMIYMYLMPMEVLTTFKVVNLGLKLGKVVQTLVVLQ